MAPSAIVHLPNGQNLTVTPVFGGLYFKSNDLSSHHAPFPPGWTVVLNSEDDEEEELDTREVMRSIESTKSQSAPTSRSSTPRPMPKLKHMVHRFKKPTMHNDHLFISSISQPGSEFKPTGSPTRQIAMMLWATLWWYFHQPVPHLHISNTASERRVEDQHQPGRCVQEQGHPTETGADGLGSDRRVCCRCRFGRKSRRGVAEDVCQPTSFLAARRTHISIHNDPECGFALPWRDAPTLETWFAQQSGRSR